MLLQGHRLCNSVQNSCSMSTLASRPLKRRRSTLAKDALRSSILKSFQTSSRGTPNRPAAVSPPLCSVPKPAPSHNVNMLTGALSCLSTQPGRVAIEALQRALCERKISPAAASAVLLEDEEDAPPLCCVAYLVDCGAIRAVDLDPASVAERARVVLGMDDDPCRCSSRECGSLYPLIISIAAAGRSHVRDAVLGALVRPLIAGGSDMAQAGSCDRSFTLATQAIEFVREADMDPNDRASLFSEWIRLAIGATPAASLSNVGRDPGRIWSSELCSVACGENIVGLLMFKDKEAAALGTLYGSVSPIIAGKIFLSTLASIFQDNTHREAEAAVSECPVNFARALLLARRACDPWNWKDVDGSNGPERASFSASLHTALCSPHVSREPRLVSYIVAVTRYICLCPRNQGSADDTERGYRDYEKWVAGVSSGGSKIALKSLCSCLTELAPVENALYLKASIRAFSRAHRASDLAKEYIMLARTRLADLEGRSDQHERHGTSAALAADRSAKAASDITRFVAEFSRAGNVIPPALVRHMNFHRSHFRSILLEPLLSADLRPAKDYLDEEFPVSGFVRFNEQRIALIKVMAFERKDRAVTRSEAEGAITAIREKLAEADVMDTAAREDAAQVTIDSSVQVMVNGIAAAVVAEDLSSFSLDLSQTPSARIVGLLSSKLASLERAEGSDMFQTVDNLLHALLSALSNSENIAVEDRARCQEASTLQGENEVVSLLRGCRRWVSIVVRHVFGDCRLARMRRAFQHRLLLLLCVQNEALSLGHMKALAVLVYCITSLSSDPALHDLAYVLLDSGAPRLRHLADVIASQMELGSSRATTRAMQFSVSYTMLVLSQPCPRISLTPISGPPAGFPGKENISPLRVISDENEEVVLCSQSSVENDPENDQPQPESRATMNYLPQGFVRIIRWLLTCPWRLRCLQETSGNESNALLSLLRSAVAVLEAQPSCDVAFDVEAWIFLELRAGWGREEEATDVLRRFVSTSDSNYGSVIGTVARVIAEGEFRAQASDRPHRVPAHWLILAISSLGRSSHLPASRVRDTVKDPTNRSKSVFEEVEKLAVNFPTVPGRSHVVASMFRVLHHVPAELYFRSCAPYIVAHHVPMALAPLHWPLSATITKVLVNGALKSSSAREGADMGPALRAAVACHWASIRETGAVAEAMLSAEKPPGLLVQAKGIWVTVNHVLNLDNTISSATADLDGINVALDVVCEERSAVASTLLSLPFLESRRGKKVTSDSWKTRLASFLNTLCTSNHVGPATDLLDNLAELSARSPFIGTARMDSGRAAQWDAWSMATLVVVMEARVLQFDAADAAMFKIGTDDDDQSHVSLALDELGLRGCLPREQCADPPARKGFGLHDSLCSDIPARDTCVVSKLSKGRMISAYAKLSDSAWSRLIRLHDAAGNVEGLLLVLVDFAVVLSNYIGKELQRLAHVQPEVWNGACSVAPRTQRGVHSAIERCATQVRRLVEPCKINEKFKVLSPTLWERLVGER